MQDSKTQLESTDFTNATEKSQTTSATQPELEQQPTQIYTFTETPTNNEEESIQIPTNENNENLLNATPDVQIVFLLPESNSPVLDSFETTASAT